MKTITKTFNVYNYEELGEKARNKAREKIKNYLIDGNFWALEDDLQYILEDKYNLTGFTINYSLCYCQGDGVCFYDKKQGLLSYKNIANKKDMNIFEKYVAELEKSNKEQYDLVMEYLNCNYNLFITKNSFHYSHCHTCFIDYESFYNTDDKEEEESINNTIFDLTKKLFVVYCSICGELERIGYQCYNVEEEDVKEYCNEYELQFLEDGSIYEEN